MHSKRSPLIFVLGFTALIALSCQTAEKPAETATRSPQQVVEDNLDAQERYEISFMAAMNASGATEAEKDLTRAAQMESYMNRQLSFFYIAQDLVNKFDQKLDKIYRRKLKNPKLEVDPQELEKDLLELSIAREFNDKNLNEIQYIYERLLQESNTPTSLYQRAATLSLQKFDKFFEKSWKNGDRLAVFSMAQDFDDINENILERLPHAKLPQFRKYLNTTVEERKDAYKQSLKLLKTRQQSHQDILLEKTWQDYKTERWSDHVELSKDRAPQSDTLYPDPGAPGNITGSHFKAGVWALTMDDGPHPTYTQGMLKAIQAGGLKGTFFWLSQNIKIYPSLVKLAGDSGFRRGNHSYTHANLPKLGEAGLKHEIDDAGDVFAQIVGERPTFFRCPYGACGPNGSRIRQKIANQHMMHVLWNVDSLDWQDKNPQSVFERTKKQMDVSGHGIVLMHDIHPQSVEAMKLVVAYIKSKPNWNAYTMDEIYKLETGNDYHSP